MYLEAAAVVKNRREPLAYKAFPAVLALLASRALDKLNCVAMPSMRCVELMFLTQVIW